jgi:hypothetical protein
VWLGWDLDLSVAQRFNVGCAGDASRWQIAGVDARSPRRLEGQNLLLADREVTEFGFKKPKNRQLAEAIRWQAAKPDTRWVFILDRVMAPCIDRDKAVVVGHANRREWLMFKADAVMPACRGGVVPDEPWNRTTRPMPSRRWRIHAVILVPGEPLIPQRAVRHRVARPIRQSMPRYLLFATTPMRCPS